MTELTKKEIEALEELKQHFEHSLKNVESILENKLAPENSSDEIEYILRDNSSHMGGYQTGSVVDALNVLDDLDTKLKEAEESVSISSNQNNEVDGN